MAIDWTVLQVAFQAFPLCATLLYNNRHGIYDADLELPFAPENIVPDI